MKTIKHKLPLFATIFSIFFGSCVGKYQNETKIFSKYLRDNFNLELKTERQIFFVDPGKGCSGCGKFLVQKLKNIDFAATLITVAEISQPLPSNITVLFDKKQTIARLDLGVGSTFFVVTENNKITHIAELNPLNFDDELGKINWR